MHHCSKCKNNPPVPVIQVAEDAVVVPLSRFGSCYGEGKDIFHTPDCQCDRDYMEELDNGNLEMEATYGD